MFVLKMIIICVLTASPVCLEMEPKGVTRFETKQECMDAGRTVAWIKGKEVDGYQGKTAIIGITCDEEGDE